MTKSMYIKGHNFVKWYLDAKKLLHPNPVVISKANQKFNEEILRNVKVIATCTVILLWQNLITTRLTELCDLLQLFLLSLETSRLFQVWSKYVWRYRRYISMCNQRGHQCRHRRRREYNSLLILRTLELKRAY